MFVIIHVIIFCCFNFTLTNKSHVSHVGFFAKPRVQVIEFASSVCNPTATIGSEKQRYVL
jgi:hypothetical protein